MKPRTRPRVTATRTGRRLALRVFSLLAPTLAGGLLVLVLMHWHQATRVALTLTVDRLAATVALSTAGEGAVTLLNSGTVRAVRVDRVTRVDFVPGTLELADETRYDLKTKGFPETAWQPVVATGAVALRPIPDAAGGPPAVTLQAQDAATPGLIKVVRTPADSLIVMDLGMEESGKRVWLTLDFAPAAAPATVDLVFPGAFLLFADALSPVTGLAQNPGGNTALTLSLRVASPTNTAVSIRGATRGLVLQAEPSGLGDALLKDIQIPVRAVEFTRQGPLGERLSSLVGGGTLRYPELPAKDPLPLAAGTLISLDGLARARIESLRVVNEDGRVGLRLTLDAVAAGVRIGTPEQPRDARLSWFDWLWHQPGLGALFATVVWLFTTTLAGYKLWQEIRSDPGGH